MAVIPPSLKLITSALRRAEELEKEVNNYEANVVSYYCRFYSVSKGSTLCSKPSTIVENNFLTSQMSILEKQKPTLDLNQEKGNKICKSYATMVFDKADEEDRAGVADKGTAKLFYAAGTFFDILEQFGPLDNEISEKKKYAKWRATEILNAIKAGERPEPGGYGVGLVDLNLTSDNEDISTYNTHITSSNTSNINSINYGIPSAPPIVITVDNNNINHNNNNITKHSITNNPSNISSTELNKYYTAQVPIFNKPPLSNLDPRVKDSIELCSFAIAAMKKNELSIAKERLKEALQRLELIS